jgi:Holliday junction resolvasome RuvABC ATP-dependent DNA helicase subunit
VGRWTATIERAAPSRRSGAHVALRPKTWRSSPGRTGRNSWSLDTRAPARQPVDHLLFSGPPGCDHWAIVANEMGATDVGPALDRPGDLASILTLLTTGRCSSTTSIMPRTVEIPPGAETNPTFGEGADRAEHRLELPRFTDRRTTRPGIMPLCERFCRRAWTTTRRRSGRIVAVAGILGGRRC